MITDHHLSWLKEFLERAFERETDRNEVPEIMDTFRKLWAVARAAEKNPHPRSSQLAEALLAIKPPPQAVRKTIK